MLEEEQGASLLPWVWVFFFIFPRSLSPAETLKIVTYIERQKEKDNEKENEERAGSRRRATWFRPFLFQTHNRLRRLEGWDGPPGRPVGCGLLTGDVGGRPGGSSLPLPLFGGSCENWYKSSKRKSAMKPRVRSRVEDGLVAGDGAGVKKRSGVHRRKIGVIPTSFKYWTLEFSDRR